VDFLGGIGISGGILSRRRSRPMPRVGIVVCLVGALLLSGCQGLPQTVTEFKRSLNPGQWWDDHPILCTTVAVAAITGVVVGAVALVVVAEEAQKHTDRGY
jgi:hypothetical protein